VLYVQHLWQVLADVVGSDLAAMPAAVLDADVLIAWQACVDVVLLMRLHPAHASPANDTCTHVTSHGVQTAGCSHALLASHKFAPVEPFCLLLQAMSN
jgi:hypothetical protein